MTIINPLVTVVMPTYNRAHLILESLNSVVNQTYSNWECVIVDDGSTDDTEQLLLRIIAKEDRIQYFKKENEGAAIARNYGISKSKGSYILPLDSDDLIAESYIEKAVQQFQSNSNLKIVYCEANFFEKQMGKWELPEYNYKLFLIYNMIFNTAMFSRMDFERVGGYNENTSLEDWDFWIKILKNGGEVYQIPEILFYYRIHENGSVTNKLNRKDKNYFDSMNTLFKNHVDEYLMHIGNPIELERARRALASEVKKADYKLAKQIIDSKLFKFIKKIVILFKPKNK